MIKLIKTIIIASLVVFVLVLAWQFNMQQMPEKMLDWIESLGATPRAHYP